MRRRRRKRKFTIKFSQIKKLEQIIQNLLLQLEKKKITEIGLNKQ